MKRSPSKLKIKYNDTIKKNNHFKNVNLVNFKIDLTWFKN